MALWGMIFGKNEKLKSYERKQSTRFHYESGDEEKMQLFKGLPLNVKSSLRSLYLEKCSLEGEVLLRSLSGCSSLTTIRLYDVSVTHGSFQIPMPKFQKLELPALKTLYVSDFSDECRSVLARPFHKIISQDELRDQEEFVQYHLEFYSQFLQFQLSRTGCRLLVNCKFVLCAIDLSVSLNGYHILKYSPLDGFEKLIVSPWLGQVKNQFLKDPSDRSQVKHLACSDSTLTVAKCPEELIDLNLFLFKDSLLLNGLVESGKLSFLKNLTLQLHHRTSVDVSILSKELTSLSDLAVTNAVVYGSRKQPLRLDSCYFDQCVFSEALITDVTAYLDCFRIAVDMLPTPNWEECFKPRLMLMPRVRTIVVYQVSTDAEGQEKIFDPIMYTKKRAGVDAVWEEDEFADIQCRRHIFFNRRDLLQDNSQVYVPSRTPEPAPINPAFLKFNPQGSSSFLSMALMGATAWIVYHYLLTDQTQKKGGS